MRSPGRNHHRDFIRLGNLLWEITVSSSRFNEETGVSELLQVVVFLGGLQSPDPALGTDMSIEILDHTGLYTVFQRESSRDPTCLVLSVRRGELEASSCIRCDDSFYVRCTIKEKRRPGLLGNWFSSKSEVDMSWHHTLTVGSLSEIKAALPSSESVHSTRFAVGGSRWYLKLCPGLGTLRLVRAIKEGEEKRLTAKFSFVLEGAVNVQSEKMTHTFDHDSSDCEFKYQQPPEEEPSTTLTDHLVVSCCVKVIPPVDPTAIPSPTSTIPATVPRPAPISPTVPAPTESVLTPLLRTLQD
jgi:hypothetical protein